jgi:hypothetical protein
MVLAADSKMSSPRRGEGAKRERRAENICSERRGEIERGEGERGIREL